jgi:nucleoside-diphosphate-sugar epimerase
MAKKILIIGGTGIIGRHIAKICAENGRQVTCFHRKKSPLNASLSIAEITGDRENIINYNKEFLALRPDVVIDTFQ